MESAHILDQFLQEVERRAFGMALSETNNRDDALEIVQETMTKFVEKYAHKPKGEWAPLFYRVLKNQTLDFFRRSKVRNRWRVFFREQPSNASKPTEMLQAMQDPSAIDPLQDIAGKSAIEQLQIALQQLPERQRQVFYLRLWEGLDVQQTASALEITEGSVKTHYSRAIHRLREQLQGHWP